MQKQFLLKNLPKQRNPQIKTDKLTDIKVVALHFRGRWDDFDFQRQEKLLKNWLENEGIWKASNLIYVFYNKPMILKFFWKSEILLELP